MGQARLLPKAQGTQRDVCHTTIHPASALFRVTPPPFSEMQADLRVPAGIGCISSVPRGLGSQAEASVLPEALALVAGGLGWGSCLHVILGGAPAWSLMATPPHRMQEKILQEAPHCAPSPAPWLGALSALGTPLSGALFPNVSGEATTHLTELV